MEHLQQQIDQALEEFQKGSFVKAFSSLLEVYRADFKQEEIYDFLYDAYYEPNQEILQQIYNQNVEYLKEYPYFRGTEWQPFDRLSYQFFPVDNSHFCAFDLHTRTFGEMIETETEEPPCFFENLDQPLFIENEKKESNLTFLFDNVRCSEDYAGDNHIYLYYSDYLSFSQVLQTIELQPLLSKKQFVFLVGEENKAQYPLDFKKEFAIDYSSLKLQPLRIEEIKRITFYYKYAHSGTTYFFPAFEKNSYVFCYLGEVLYTIRQKAGSDALESFLRILKEPKKKYDRTSALLIIGDYAEVFFNFSSSQKKVFLNRLDVLLEGKEKISVKELFCAIFVARDYVENGKYKLRISPMLFFDPHVWDYSIFMPLLDSFDLRYVNIFASFRHPLYMLESSLKAGLLKDEFQISYLFGSTYTHTKFLSDKYFSKFRIARLEDGKIFPEQTFRAICKFMNVPYQRKMVNLSNNTYYSRSMKKKISASDVQTVTRPLDPYIFPEEDQKRLLAFYEPILKKYGYDTTLIEGLSYSMEELLEPYVFEKIIADAYRLHYDDVRKWISHTILQCFQLQKSNQVFYPELISPEEKNL